MTLNELYEQKGRLTTQIEIAQAQLQKINSEIVVLINELKEKKPQENP